jgi:hypothetical protein
LSNPGNKAIILRNDVDKLPQNSLQFAKIQTENGMKGTYYFRIVPESFNEQIIKEIYSLGHEIGYHYEDVSLTANKMKTINKKVSSKKYEVNSKKDEDYERQVADIAIESFVRNLERLRKIAPVKTICMHGSPMSRWDSRLLWKYYDYRDFGIIGEPYFDVNFDEVMYLTDTGRRWNGDSVNIRDKAEGRRRKATGEEVGSKEYEVSSKEIKKNINFDTENRHTPNAAYRKPFPKFHSTFDLIRAAEEGRLPDKIMMTFHPQRWPDKPVPWIRELVWQNVKNVGKYFVVRLRQ